MPHALINNALLWYDTMGYGEPLLLHHGYTACRDNWMPVAQRLKDRYRIIPMPDTAWVVAWVMSWGQDMPKGLTN